MLFPKKESNKKVNNSCKKKKTLQPTSHPQLGRPTHDEALESKFPTNYKQKSILQLVLGRKF